MHSGYDLKRFSRATQQRIKALEFDIKKTIPSTRFSARDFIKRCEDGTVTAKLFDEEGPILALQWALAREEGRDKEAEPKGVEEGAFEAASAVPRARYTPADVAIPCGTLTADGPGRTLFDVAWHSNHVQALLQDDSASSEALPTSNRRPWMEPTVAEMVFRDAAADGVQLMCNDLLRIGDLALGDGMEMDLDG
jgi:hypothetical protein